MTRSTEVTERFRVAFAGLDDPAVSPVEMLPARLAVAAAQVLPVAGIGLSQLSRDFRVPLGASDQFACDAERLQFTYGEGPCLQANRTARTVRAGVDRFQEVWPIFYADLVAHTPYRSVIALPLGQMAAWAGGALDLYLVDPHLADTLDVTDALAVAAQIAGILAAAQTHQDPEGLPGPAWLHGPSAEDRMKVWIAVGMINTDLRLHNDDVLALLRGYAFAHDTTLDAVSLSVLERRLPADALRI
jgi:hypothetical protein